MYHLTEEIVGKQNWSAVENEAVWRTVIYEYNWLEQYKNGGCNQFV